MIIFGISTLNSLGINRSTDSMHKINGTSVLNICLSRLGQVRLGQVGRSGKRFCCILLGDVRLSQVRFASFYSKLKKSFVLHSMETCCRATVADCTQTQTRLRCQCFFGDFASLQYLFRGDTKLAHQVISEEKIFALTHASKFSPMLAYGWVFASSNTYRKLLNTYAVIVVVYFQSLDALFYKVRST